MCFFRNIFLQKSCIFSAGFQVLTALSLWYVISAILAFFTREIHFSFSGVVILFLLIVLTSFVSSNKYVIFVTLRSNRHPWSHQQYHCIIQSKAGTYLPRLLHHLKVVYSAYLISPSKSSKSTLSMTSSTAVKRWRLSFQAKPRHSDLQTHCCRIAIQDRSQQRPSNASKKRFNLLSP